ncbi:MAG: FAD synthetase family protein [Lactobacillus sp.]|jgi:riboflavin kinase/FMN adenylyltransferase|nr:FAD synthetase family protein [Lactobacillus sp.]MCI2033245.1 FAD synthetase family protein [Lactobacillus sp.]
MDVITLTTANIASLAHERPSVLALGFFDGVHRGHQRVLATAKHQAANAGLPLAVMTFDRHASQVFPGPHSADFRYLTTLDQKAALMADLGVERLYVVRFTPAFASLSPAAFVSAYLVGLHARRVVAGFDYTFGRGGVAGVQTLARLAAGRFATTVVTELQQGQDKVSSTRIRRLIATGQLVAAEALLGHPYVVSLQAQGAALVPQSAQQLPPAGAYLATTGAGAEVVVEVNGKRVLGLTAPGGVQLRFKQAQALTAIG